MMEPVLDEDLTHETDERSGAEQVIESPMERIRRRRRERSDLLEIDIPSWDGDIVGYYKVLGTTELQRMVQTIRRRANDGNAKGGDADIDFLIKACVEIKGVDDDGEKFHLSDGYTMDLVPKLEPEDEDGNPIAIKNPRQLVSYMMGKIDPSIALATHVVRVARWMQDTSKSVEDPQ